VFDGVSQLRQTPHGLVRVCQALHAAVAAVALGELGLDACEDLRMLVDASQGRKCHQAATFTHRSPRRSTR
jgi:hypothetical protein